MAKKSLNYIKDKYRNNVNFLGEVEVNSFVNIIRSKANRNEEEDIMGNNMGNTLLSNNISYFNEVPGEYEYWIENPNTQYGGYDSIFSEPSDPLNEDINYPDKFYKEDLFNTKTFEDGNQFQDFKIDYDTSDYDTADYDTVDFSVDFNSFNEYLNKIENIFGEEFIIALFSCDLDLQEIKRSINRFKMNKKIMNRLLNYDLLLNYFKNKKVKTKKVKKKKQKPYMKKSKKKKSKKKKKKKMKTKKSKQGSKKSGKTYKSKQTKKKNKKSSKKGKILIDLSGFRDLVS